MTAGLTATAPTVATMTAESAAPGSLPTYRVNIMRIGYLLMAVGLAMTRWPLVPHAASLPVFEGVVTALLTAMSLLALLGLRHPVQMVPLLVLESAWKLIWLGAVALPRLIASDVDADTGSVLFSVSFVVVILAVTPWDYVWQRYVKAPGERWR